MRSKTVQRLFDEMKNDPWHVKLMRWYKVKVWTYKCLTRKYWDKTFDGYIFKKKEQDKQKQLLTEIMNADAKDGLYDHVPDVGKKVTAVEWFFNQLSEKTQANNEKEYYKAKQMEKEQILDAYSCGECNIDNHGFYIDKNGAEQYYNETYGGLE